jgi:molybdate transport system regulatory protein
MRAVTNVFLYHEDEKFFGEGPCRLLHGVETYGSLRAAAMQMNLSYSKATAILNRAEKALGFPLTEKTIGGKGGGGSRLTAEAKAFLKKYEEYREACYETNRRLYCEIFSE